MAMQAKDYALAVTTSFAMPETCTKVRTMVDDGTSRAEDLAAIIALDPSISSKLLKLANSALFRFPAQITTLSKAVNVIGGEAIYNLVMTEIAASAFNQLASESIDIDRFWRQSVNCSLLAKNLSKMAHVRGSEQFYLLGLLHQFGELAVLNLSPGLAAECEKFSKDEAPWELQQRILGFDYATIASMVFSDWGLPKSICDLVKDQNNQQKAMQRKNVGLLYLSARVALHMVKGGEDGFGLNELIDESQLSFLGLSWEDIEDSITFSRLETENILHIMNPDRY